MVNSVLLGCCSRRLAIERCQRFSTRLRLFTTSSIRISLHHVMGCLPRRLLKGARDRLVSKADWSDWPWPWADCRELDPPNPQLRSVRGVFPFDTH